MNLTSPAVACAINHVVAVINPHNNKRMLECMSYQFHQIGPDLVDLVKAKEEEWEKGIWEALKNSHEIAVDDRAKLHLYNFRSGIELFRSQVRLLGAYDLLKKIVDWLHLSKHFGHKAGWMDDLGHLLGHAAVHDRQNGAQSSLDSWFHSLSSVNQAKALGADPAEAAAVDPAEAAAVDPAEAAPAADPVTPVTPVGGNGFQQFVAGVLSRIADALEEQAKQQYAQNKLLVEANENAMRIYSEVKAHMVRENSLWVDANIAEQALGQDKKAFEDKNDVVAD